jgi:hypothetical protein
MILAPQTNKQTNTHTNTYTHAYHIKESDDSTQRCKDMGLLQILFVVSYWRKRYQHVNSNKSRDYKSFRCACTVLYAFGNRSLESDCWYNTCLNNNYRQYRRDIGYRQRTAEDLICLVGYFPTLSRRMFRYTSSPNLSLSHDPCLDRPLRPLSHILQMHALTDRFDYSLTRNFSRRIFDSIPQIVHILIFPLISLKFVLNCLEFNYNTTTWYY